MDKKDFVELLFEGQQLLNEKIDSIIVVQTRQEENLKEHMKRSDLLEENLNILRNDFKPVEKHVHYVEGALKLLGAISVLIGIIIGIVQVFK